MSTVVVGEVVVVWKQKNKLNIRRMVVVVVSGWLYIYIYSGAG